MNVEIKMNQVNVKYKNTHALQDVTLTLPYGKIYGLLGRNGAGKTTMLRLLSSYQRPTSGEVKLGGQHVFENAEMMSLVSLVFEEVIILHEGRVLLHESVDRLLERGVSITGAVQAVDEFISGMQVLRTERLGGMKKATVYGELMMEQLSEARKRGLEVGHISLQDLFIHLTGREDDEK